MTSGQDKENKILEYLKTLETNSFKNLTLDAFVNECIKDKEVFKDREGYNYDDIRSFCELIHDKLSKKQLKFKSFTKYFRPKKTTESSLNNNRKAKDIKSLVRENEKKTFVNICINECKNKFQKLVPVKVATNEVGVQEAAVQYKDSDVIGKEGNNLYDNSTIEDIIAIIKNKVCKYVPERIKSSDDKFKIDILCAVKKLQALLAKEENGLFTSQSQYKDMCDSIIDIIGQTKFVTVEDLVKIFQIIDSLPHNVDEISQNKLLGNDSPGQKNLYEIKSEIKLGLSNFSEVINKLLENNKEENLQKTSFEVLKQLQISLKRYIKLLNLVESDFTIEGADLEKYIQSLSELEDNIESIFSRNLCDSTALLINILANIYVPLNDRSIEGYLSESIEEKEEITKENLSAQIDKMQNIISRRFERISEINSQKHSQVQSLIIREPVLLQSDIDVFISSLENAKIDNAHESDVEVNEDLNRSKLFFVSYIDSFTSSPKDVTEDDAHKSDIIEFNKDLNHYINKLEEIKGDPVFITGLPLIYSVNELGNHLMKGGDLDRMIQSLNNQAPTTPPPTKDNTKSAKSTTISPPSMLSPSSGIEDNYESDIFMD